MSFQSWVEYGWLKAHQSSREEIGNLFGIIDRDLKDCDVPGLSADARLERAYNAALQCATVALFASGYRASSRDNHYKVIESLEMTLQDAEIKQKLDAFGPRGTNSTTKWLALFPIVKSKKWWASRAS